MRLLVSLLLVLLTLTGCSQVKRGEVVGSYVLDSPASGYSLQLKADGTYVHTWVAKDGKRSEETGKWEWDEDDPDNPIYLDSFAEFPDEDIGGIPGSLGLFILHPERSINGIRFAIGDSDSASHYFVRRDSDPH
jgi:hypothetical protein